MRILVVEDDPDLNRQVTAMLTESGYAVDSADDGEDAHHLGETEPYDGVVLDLGLPSMDGMSVLERWREAGLTMPVLVLSARDRWNDVVRAMDAGADDYVRKPVELEELLSKLRALLRRATGHVTNEIRCGPLCLDTKRARLTVEGEAIRLTSHEYRLLSYLMHHQDRIVSRTELVEHMYDQDFDRDSNTIEVFVGRLRKKLPDDLIRTVRGLGYCLSDPNSGG